MDDDIDAEIKRLAAQATHPKLVGMEDAVLGRVAAEKARRAQSWRLDAIALLGALAIGIAGAMTAPAPTVSAIALFWGISHLAPSTLLEGPR